MYCLHFTGNEQIVSVDAYESNILRRLIRESLKENTDHVCVQMDFSENYSLKEKEEVQSFYFNPQWVTLHPVVISWGKDGKVVHS